MGGNTPIDDHANGYSYGEGVSSIVLEPVLHATRDGDTVRATVRGTGSNQEGDITLPLIYSTVEKSGLNSIKTIYLEAHGKRLAVFGWALFHKTFPPLKKNPNGEASAGIPAEETLETGALDRVFCGTYFKGSLKLGSIKANVGHLEGAGRIAGVFKNVLVLENQIVLPNQYSGNLRMPLYD